LGERVFFSFAFPFFGKAFRHVNILYNVKSARDVLMHC
jgi:hypothetical protein